MDRVAKNLLLRAYSHLVFAWASAWKAGKSRLPLCHYVFCYHRLNQLGQILSKAIEKELGETEKSLG